MRNNNRNKLGYKQTPLGWIPQGWDVHQLSAITDNFKSGEGITSSHISDVGKFPVYGGNGLRGYTKSYTHDGEYILIGRQGALCGNILMVKGKTYISEHAIAVSVNGKTDLIWLGYTLIYKNLNRLSESSAQPGLAVNKLLKLKVTFPPLPEQRKIAIILSTWDEAITIIQQLIVTLQKRNKGLMQQLLSGKKRLKGFENSEWKMVPLNSLFERVKRTSPENSNNVEVLTISGRFGFLSQKEKFNRVIAGESLKNYTLLRRGEFSYNKGNSLAYQYGCVFKLDEYPEALVPNVYISFKPIAEIDTDYYAYYFKHDLLKPSLAKIISSGARMDGLLNVNAEDFFKIKVPFPSHKEQYLIGCMLTNSFKELTLYKQKLTELQQQKKGLMQKLLTGEVRVKGQISSDPGH